MHANTCTLKSIRARRPCLDHRARTRSRVTIDSPLAHEGRDPAQVSRGDQAFFGNPCFRHRKRRRADATGRRWHEKAISPGRAPAGRGNAVVARRNRIGCDPRGPSSDGSNRNDSCERRCCAGRERHRAKPHTTTWRMRLQPPARLLPLSSSRSRPGITRSATTLVIERPLELRGSSVLTEDADGWPTGDVAAGTETRVFASNATLAQLIRVGQDDSERPQRRDDSGVRPRRNHHRHFDAAQSSPGFSGRG